MRKSPILFLGLIGTAISFGWGCGDDGGGSGGAGGGQGQPCERDDDCENTDCSFGFCISGFCDIQVADDGPVPNLEQTDGDCKSINCKAGEVVEENANDPSDDPDGSDCMIPACEDGMNLMVEEEVGQGCDSGNGDGRCDVGGVCTCAIVDGPNGQVAYVDPDNGQDIPGNGGDNGACAFATIEYALTQAPGEIRLPPIDFNVAGTLSLTGAQRLSCSVDDNNNTQTRLIGDGAAPVVSFDGMANRIRDCDVDGQGASAAVVVTSVAPGTSHEVRDSIVGNAVDGILVSGGNVDVNGNNIHDNSGVGLNFTAADTTGDVNNNQFVNNGTDVSCADASENVDGGGNQLNSCTTCMNCNF